MDAPCMGRLKDAWELVGCALAESEPDAQAGRVVTYLAHRFHTTLCGFSFSDGEDSSTVVATTLPSCAVQQRLDLLRGDGGSAPQVVIRMRQTAGSLSDDTGEPGHFSLPGIPAMKLFWFGPPSGIEQTLQDAGEMLGQSMQRSIELRKVAKLATTDPLTGLHNSRAFWAVLGHECARSMRYGNRLTLAMIDLDGFKIINDKLGHPIGDQVLRDAAQAIRLAVRESDLVARLGGDEFGIILPDTDVAQAHIAAARVISGLSQVGADDLCVRGSAGLAELSADANTAEALVAAADRALYESKRHGGNGATFGTEFRRVA